MKVLLVRMPDASARDRLAIAAECVGNSDLLRDADLVVGLWGSDDSAVLMKDRHGLLGDGMVTVVNAASVQAVERDVLDQVSATEPVEVSITMDKLGFRAYSGPTKGSILRGLPTPPIGDDYDLFLGSEPGPDVLVHPDELYDVEEGMIFFRVPKAIVSG